MKKLLTLIILVSIISCKKDKPDPVPPSNPPPVNNSGCNINTTLEGTWRSDSIHSWYTDSLDNLIGDTTFATNYPQFYLEYQFYCIEDHPFGWNPDTIIQGPPGWKDHTYVYFKEVDFGGGVDDTNGYDTFYYGNGVFYFGATSPLDTANFMGQAIGLTSTNLIFTGSGVNGLGGISSQSIYFTKQ